MCGPRTRETPQTRRAHGEHHFEVAVAIRVQQDQHGRPPADGQRIPQRERRRPVCAQACYCGLGSRYYVVHDEAWSLNGRKRRHISILKVCAHSLFILTVDTAFSGAMLERSQYAPSSNSCKSLAAAGGGDVGPEEASLMLSMMVCTSASVGGVMLSSCSVDGSEVCPFDGAGSVAPAILYGCGRSERGLLMIL